MDPVLIFKSARTRKSINWLNTGDAGKLEKHAIPQTLNGWIEIHDWETLN